MFPVFKRVRACIKLFIDTFESIWSVFLPFAEEKVSSGLELNMASHYEFQVEMTCEGCSGAVTRVLTKKGIAAENIEIDMNKQRVYVTSDLSSEELLETIKKAGKPCSFIAKA